jgi:hypothetical protein
MKILAGFKSTEPHHIPELTILETLVAQHSDLQQMIAVTLLGQRSSTPDASPIDFPKSEPRHLGRNSKGVGEAYQLWSVRYSYTHASADSTVLYSRAIL